MPHLLENKAMRQPEGGGQSCLPVSSTERQLACSPRKADKIVCSPLPVLLALLALILLPVLLRSRQAVSGVADEVLVVIGPHNESVRHEIDRAFTAAHLRKTGRRVRIDWRSPGGASEVARYLAAEYLGAFQYEWETRRGQPWNAEVQAAFDSPRVKPADADAPETAPLAARARAAFLASNVGSRIDVLFGGGSFEFMQQAAAGRLVPCEAVRDFQKRVPETLSGETLWDRQAHWAGVTLAAFGITWNTDALLRFGVKTAPETWAALADPRLRGALAVADPTQSGSACKAFEMLVQQQIAESVAAGGSVAEGWARAMRLIQRIAANSRYFSDAASRIVWDVESGDAAAGMVIDFYGRFQSESVRRPDGTSRMQYATPAGGSSYGTDPIGLLRGAPSPALASEFIAFVLSEEGQKLWNWKLGAPGGPRKYALRRMPILPELYEPRFAAFRSDPGENPFLRSQTMPPYHPEWTSPLFRALAFTVQVMALDPHEELAAAWEALIETGFPPRATALFDDVTAVSYEAELAKIKPALSSGDKMDTARLAKELGSHFREQYRRVARLAREEAGARVSHDGK